MRKLDATHIFAYPSLGSSLFVLIGAAVILTAFNLSVITRSGIIKEILLGSKTSSDLLHIAETTTFEISQLTLGNPVLNNIAFFLFWMVIGLFVFISLSTFSSTLSKITQSIEVTRYKNRRKSNMDQNTLLRWAVRLAGVGGMLLFYLLFARLIVPFAVLANRAWIGNLDAFSGWLYGLLGFVVLALSLHVFVICARAALLKPRIFGGWGDVA